MIPVRRLLAAELTVGVAVAAADAIGRTRACKVERIRRLPNGTIVAWVSVLHGPDGGVTEGRIRFDGREIVSVLPTHYGVCSVCGALSPCADEQNEREAEEIFAASDPFPDVARGIVGPYRGVTL